MRKIGYIYRYNENEGKGILAYEFTKDSSNIQKKPIKFYKEDCITPVRTGQLAYFLLDDDMNALQIERASLANFDRELVYKIALYYENEKLDDCYSKTHISFENIDILRIPLQEKPNNTTYSNHKHKRERGKRIIYGDDILGKSNYYEDDQSDTKVSKSILEQTLSTLKYSDITKSKNLVPVELPDTIDALYEIFGCHYNQIYWRYAYYTPNSLTIDIFDINYWLDKDVTKSESLYGRTAEQVIDIFELFVQKRRNAYISSSRKVYDSISPNWRYLLSNLPTEDLREICIKEPLLQPAMPRKFCLDNLDVLTINQGFPSISICEAYYRYRICNTYSLAEFKTLFDRLLNATYCTGEHKKNEGVPPCKMKKSVLHELKDLLEDQCRTVVLGLLKQKLKLISNSRINEGKIKSLFSQNKRDYLYILDLYVDLYDTVLEKLDYSTIRDFVNTFNDLTDEDKEILKASFIEKSKACVVKIAKSEYGPGKARNLYFALQRFSNVLDIDTIEVIRTIVNSEFAELNDLEELNYAYSSNMITETQCIERYKQLTNDYDLEQIMHHINDAEIPFPVQDYLLDTIIQKFNFIHGYSEEHIVIDKDVIYTKEALIRWFDKHKGCRNLDSEIVSSKELELAKDLSKVDRWRLFQNGLISSPSYDNIREKLDYAYSHKEPDDLYRYILSDCFQQVMADDAINRTDFNKLSFILKHLNNDYKNRIIDNSSELLQFYLWAIEPNKSVDKNLIRKFFHSLPYYAQIRSFRFLFYLIATGNENYSITELRDLITDDGKNIICYPLRIVLFLLEKKSSDLKASISNMEFRKAAALEVEPEVLYSSDINISFDSLKTSQIEVNGEITYIEGFFETCTGHRLLSWRNQFFDDITFNGEIDKHEENGELFYVISFYFLPVDANGNSKGYSDDTDTWNAQQALERNIPNKKRNGRCWISVQYERDVRDFVIEYNIKDKYSLLCNNNSPTSPIQTYCSVQTINDKYSFCKGCKDSRSCDPQLNVPFYWCDKEPCISPKKLLNPIGKWEYYRFVDLLNILYNNDMSIRDALWDAEAEISQFLNNFVINAEETADSCPIIVADEIGEWKEDMSIMSDKCLDDDYDDEFDNDYRYDPNSERATYDKYSGSYAQDEMGYSDDDIDTIFDGDPDAYWNID